MSQHDSDYQSGLEPESPRVGSPVKPTPSTPPAPVAKKTLSDAQKASLARAREKARAAKLAKSQAKAEAEEKFRQLQEAQAKPKSSVKEEVKAAGVCVGVSHRLVMFHCSRPDSSELRVRYN